MNQFNLRDAFNGTQQEMSAILKANRMVNVHAPTKGAVTEERWREWLQEYLPKRYCVSEAFVVDCNSRCSQQIDLVIYDRQYSPFVWNVRGAKYIPAESVYAVFEIKQSLDKDNLEYAGEKIKSVRLLNRTNAPIYHAEGYISKPRDPFTILGGILTLDSGWSDPFDEPFIKVIDAFEPLQHVDLGCVLDRGSFNITYNAESGHSRELSTPEESLIYFFLKLLSRLQRMGTVPAIDIEQYARVLSSI
ncbi:hypothetical protein BEN47_18275 [Hymenobacter lapidarius]|uniref:DUF6602 domain-containing protein n=1 Tax=Hymenobacter lapidarius TaxID=1908237 RepID=A0A1G1SVR3_9BACT|nr:DUF6602 domain-containing protein [Hymenobacter lapidarius]OGX82706.1 hypothetical protein BEN47_18275 [Hymenobacter lapidarius]